MYFQYVLDSRGYIKQRESKHLEFKQNFHLGDNLLEYLKTLAGMANNQGGEIIFGIQNSPRIPLGLKNNQFDRCDPVEVTKRINEYFSPEFDWEMDTLEFGEILLGKFYVLEARHKPIVCKKSKDKILREGAIYYRYRGQTTEIKYPELSRLLQEEKEKEKKLWISHTEKLNTIGLGNVHILDSYKGELYTGQGRIIIDKTIVNQLKFIKEGQFVEINGEPTLKLIGEVRDIVDANIIATDETHPLGTIDLQEEFEFNQHQMLAVLCKLNIKGNKKFHNEIDNGGHPLHKYSTLTVDTIRNAINSDPKFVENTVEEYKKLNKMKK